jgi:CrcB protein
MMVLYVAIGGALGAILRYVVSLRMNQLGRPGYLGTWLVNILGSFVLGLLVGLQPDPMVALLIGTGFTGGLTTFSTFTVEIVRMKQMMQRISYIISSLLFGWVFAWLGWALAQWITR